ncbi:HD domain-containing phosphohydrolase, partial [Hydrogenimonas sp.]
MTRPVSIRTTILANILFVVAVTAGALLWLQYRFDTQMVLEATRQAFKSSAEKIALHLKDREVIARTVLHFLTFETPPQSPGAVTKERLLRYADVLDHNRKIAAVNIGFPDGAFFEMTCIAAHRTRLHAPSDAEWMVIRVHNEGDRRIKSTQFLSKTLRVLENREEPADFDATTRPWYRMALQHGGIVRTGVYRFAYLDVQGITYASRFLESHTVLALDLTLEDLDRVLAETAFAPGVRTFLFDAKGETIGVSEGPRRLPSLFMKMLKKRRFNVVAETRAGGRELLAMVEPFDQTAGRELFIGMLVDKAAMMAPYMRQVGYALAAALVLLLLAIPLVLYTTHRIVRPIRALMRENEKIKARRYREVKPVDTNIVELAELSGSLLAMSRSIEAYERSLKEMMESFIKLIADAIDAKSPYTGGHCKRVPVLARMLAEAASRSEEGEFKGFRFENEEAFKAFEMGAWLHDCGKITTPEFVVDKATKLETIHNRIHEIRTRFEVLWRDAEIAYCKARLAGVPEEEAAGRRDEERAKLQEEFAFVARCNLGSEHLDDAAKARLRTIAGRTWMRHFDDRLGLSEAELLRYPAEKPALPARERLIADKPEHIFERYGFDEEAYRKKGFKLHVPRHLYNRGELHNLSVERGTLTEEERFKIEEHVIMTIRMLEQIPYPPGMEKIPEYAVTHHETLDGTGYPRKLDASRLSIPARIMTIADIFEALTAADRPYKKPKTLSQALTIMAKMVEEGHLDREIFA